MGGRLELQLELLLLDLRTDVTKEDFLTCVCLVASCRSCCVVSRIYLGQTRCLSLVSSDAEERQRSQDFQWRRRRWTRTFGVAASSSWAAPSP